MRNSFAEELTIAAERDQSIRLLVGDIGYRVFDKFRIRHSDKFLNCGIAEQNMISVAAGMASEGLKPVVYTITPFLVMRAFEQIRVDIGINYTNVILVGVGAGFAYDKLGPTHHSLEDIALMRTIVGLQVYLPFDGPSTRICLQDALSAQDSGKASYIRLSKGGEPDIGILADVSRGVSLVKTGDTQIVIVTHGAIIDIILDQLGKQGRNNSVYVITILETKTIDQCLFDIVARSNGLPCISVIEEAYRNGSLYSEMAMRILELGLNVKIRGAHASHRYAFEIEEREDLLRNNIDIEGAFL